MHRLMGLACVWFACSYTPPTQPQQQLPDASEPKLDAAPIESCTPNETFCSSDGRDRVTCNADGTGLDVALTVTCPLSCVEAQCYAASHLSDAAQLGCSGATNPPSFMPAGDVTIQMANNLPQMTCVGGCGPAASTIVGSLVPQAGGDDIAMFCLRQISIPDGITVTTNGVPHPIAWFVLLDAVIDGDIDFDGVDGDPISGGNGGPGGGDGGDLAIAGGEPGEGPCPGGGGNNNGTGSNAAGGGGGGGANLDVGGNGGQGQSANNGNTATGGTGGAATCASPAFLVGGGGGGSGGDGSCSGPCGWAGGGGGGALMIATVGNLQLGSPSSLTADGGDGFRSVINSGGDGGGGGGGAGGTIVLEGTAVLLGGNFRLRGGDGADSDAGNGGGGADTTDLSGDNGASENGSGEGGAGGGGGAGRMHIRTPAINSTVCSSVSSQPLTVCSDGTLRTFP